ncbi:MAG: hypothetical protein ACI86M_001830 [Saprospiraceae bacterium]|jgi:hypothetical protein
MNIRTIYTFVIAIFFMTISCKSETKNTGINEVKKEVIADNESAVINTETTILITDEVTEASTKKVETKSADAQLDAKTPSKTKQAKDKVDTKPSNSPIKPTTNESTTIPEKPVLKDEIILDDKPVSPKNDKVEVVKQEVEKVEKPKKPSKNTKPENPVLYDIPVGYPNHKLFDGFLGAFVSNSGVVNYSGMKKKEADLNAYLTSLEKTKFNTRWSRSEKLSFWINAYNAYTIKLILDNYPVKKITDLYGGKPWDKKWIKLDGKTLSLNNIENDIIRPEFKEPRIHFAVNCAAKSCPPILNSAFTASNLEKKLQSQTKKFINNTQHNTLGKSEITISKIFDWYGADFGNVASFVAKYANSTVKPTAKIKFNEYDWALNGK